LPGELLAAFPVRWAMIAYQVDFAALKHPLCFYIPNPNPRTRLCGGGTCFRWSRVAKGVRRDSIKCMALVEAHPLAFQMEEICLESSRAHFWD